ncbi:MAG: IPT/TIG domain-containing protein [Acidobacteriota bacterium]|nr:IPT/TIG domain-containing protein [Acidobacteriota bacterium]
MVQRPFRIEPEDLTDLLIERGWSEKPSNVSMSATDRFYLWVGVNLTVSPNSNTMAELDVEGTLNGNYDSQINVPLPIAAPPSITSLSPNSGTVGASITVAGTNFGATQGTSTITFNGTAATPTSWSVTSIAVPVPAAATTGPVVVTVSGQPNNGVNFTVTPKIDSLTPTSGPVGTSVTISGSTFSTRMESSIGTSSHLTSFELSLRQRVVSI